MTDQTLYCPQNAFGFADVFKVLASSQEELDSDLTAVADWCNQNSMRVNMSKYALVTLRESISGSVQGEQLFCPGIQRYVWLQAKKSLSWNDNCRTRKKALKALFILKRSLSAHSSLVLEMNAYTGYAVLIRARSLQAWFPNITVFENLEESQKRSVRWMYISSIGDVCKKISGN